MRGQSTSIALILTFLIFIIRLGELFQIQSKIPTITMSRTVTYTTTTTLTITYVYKITTTTTLTITERVTKHVTKSCFKPDELTTTYSISFFPLFTITLTTSGYIYGEIPKLWKNKVYFTCKGRGHVYLGEDLVIYTVFIGSKKNVGVDNYQEHGPCGAFFGLSATRPIRVFITGGPATLIAITPRSETFVCLK